MPSLARLKHDAVDAGVAMHRRSFVQHHLQGLADRFKATAHAHDTQPQHGAQLSRTAIAPLPEPGCTTAYCHHRGFPCLLSRAGLPVLHGCSFAP
jgi:hypothetical protein